jgi:hypothetical protein
LLITSPAGRHYCAVEDMNNVNIIIKTIPHKKQRVGEVGDYWERKGKLTIALSREIGWKYQALVATHELVEYFLVKDRAIPIKKIDEFDKEFYRNNKKGEAGNSKNAPYFKEHKFSTVVEKMLAKELEVNWREYSKYVEAL